MAALARSSSAAAEAEEAAAPPPLLTWRREAASAALLCEIDGFIAAHCAATAGVVRRFGAEESGCGGLGHRAWYLQREAVKSGLADRLWACCAASDAWGVGSWRGEARRRLGRLALAGRS